MKILFVGVCDIEWSTNVPMVSALKSLGHDVDVFNYRTFYKSLNIDQNIFVRQIERGASFLRRYQFLPNILKYSYYKFSQKHSISIEILNLSRKRNYDLIIFSKTDTIDPRVIIELNKYAKTWYFFMDTPNVSRMIGASAYAKNATYCSATFPDVTKNFKLVNKNSVLLRQGFNPIYQYKSNLVISKGIDVLFFGQKTRDRELIIRFLSKNGVSLVCHGLGWELPPIYSNNLYSKVASAKIVLNLTRLDGEGFSVKVLDLLAMKACVVSTCSKDLTSVFDNGKHLIVSENLEDLLKNLKHLLKDEKKRSKIADCGFQKVVSEHSWAKRMSELIRVYQGNES